MADFTVHIDDTTDLPQWEYIAAKNNESDTAAYVQARIDSCSASFAAEQNYDLSQQILAAINAGDTATATDLIQAGAPPMPPVTEPPLPVPPIVAPPV